MSVAHGVYFSSDPWSTLKSKQEAGSLILTIGGKQNTKEGFETNSLKCVFLKSVQTPDKSMVIS